MNPTGKKIEKWEEQFDNYYFNWKKNPDMANLIKNFIKIQLQRAYEEGCEDGSRCH